MSFFKKRKQAESKPVTTSGITGVNFRRSGDLGNSALWACVMLLARTYSTLPLHVYEYDRKHARQRVDDKRPLPALIDKPNPFMTHCDFFFIMGFNYETVSRARFIRSVLPRLLRAGRVMISTIRSQESRQGLTQLPISWISRQHRAHTPRYLIR